MLRLVPMRCLDCIKTDRYGRGACKDLARSEFSDGSEPPFRAKTGRCRHCVAIKRLV